MTFEEKFDNLFISAREIYDELHSSGKKMNVWKEVLSTVDIDSVCIVLSRESEKLFRYNVEQIFITPDQWKYILEKSWRIGKHFPTLYNVKEVYDKREVVICFLMAMKMNLTEADEFLKKVSINERNYDNRILYALHFKESFFRFIILWNERQKNDLSFSKAVEYYEKYEVILSKKIIKYAFEILNDRKTILSKKSNQEDYENVEYYCNLLSEVIYKLEKWKHPYTLGQQDVLQRVIVLCFHAKRVENECEHSSVHMEDVLLYRNAQTRKLEERGTRMCANIMEKCAKIQNFQMALENFVEEAVSEMGEAYWRAASYIMKTYAESGNNQYQNSILARERLFSNRNTGAKEVKKINLFGENAIQKEVLSFSVSLDKIREYIRSKSANTVLLAELINPTERNDLRIFAGQQVVSNYSVLSEFLGNYITWIEGKLEQVNAGQIRQPMPYYCFKRDTVLKYALACGCTSESDLEQYLEFTGNSLINTSSLKEYLILQAIKYCQKYDRNKQIIMTIQNMQNILLYLEAQTLIRLEKNSNLIRDIESIINNISKIFLYEPEIEIFNQKKYSITKKEIIKRYYSQIILLNMLLGIICETDIDMTTQDFAPMIVEMSLVMDNKEYKDDGFINNLDQPVMLKKKYIRELQDIYFTKNVNLNNKKIFRNLVINILKILGENMLPLELVAFDNSPELKLLYEKQFFALAGINWYYKEIFTEENCALYNSLLDWVTEAGIAWVFNGGCRNFSLIWYEKQYGLNHFEKDEKKYEKRKKEFTWNRWNESLDQLEKQEIMWEMMTLDVHTIRMCYRYLKVYNPDLISGNSYNRYKEQLEKVKKEIEGLLKCLKEQDSVEGNLVSKLQNCRKELLYN